MQLNQAARELIFKVVYYGPGMAGKTTNLAYLQRRAPQGTASQLTSVDTHSERTLHFDLLALDLGAIQGHHVRVEFHTVPGQSYYAATRKQVLTGADAVVFVADSRREALDENIASMNEMLDNLRQLGLPTQIPVVLQYNKQDLPTAVRPEQLNPLMNVRNWPSRGACAVNGSGVAECADDILRQIADAAAQVELPEVPQTIEPRTWLISCHRCQAMLEVPDAAIGSIYTCGVCSSSLEVVDPDRGLTREPVAGRSPLAQPIRQQQQPPRVEEPSDYAMRTLPVQQELAANASALQRAHGGTPQGTQAIGGDFPLAGWEVAGFLDENPQARRLRVRETGSGRTARALVLSPQLMAQPGYADGIESFVRMAGPLKHPHILPLLELRPAGGTVVLLSPDMPEHETLGVVLGRRRALAPPHAMGLLRQVVLALEDAARQGVVHGWLRPECILVSPDGTVAVDEFAVPKNHRFLVRELSGASAATEYYLAPEHLGEDARGDLRSDMFLCGALLYRMITGEGLVTGYNAHEALHRLMAGGGKPLRSVGNSVSRDLDLFYRQLTALNRSERFESYRQLVEVLDRFGGGAKRQTLRLTQPISASHHRGQPGGASPGSGSYQRPSSGVHRSGTGAQTRPRSGTGSWRAPTGPIPAPQQRRTGTGEYVRHAPPRRSGGGGSTALVIIIALLAIAGVGAYVLWQQGHLNAWLPPQQPAQPVKPTPPAPRATAPAQPTPPAPAPVPPRPATASTIGAVPPDAAPVRPTEPVPPAQPVADPAPVAAAAPAAPAELTPGQRRDLLTRVTDLILEERFQAALVEAERLPAAEDRQTQYQKVIAAREAKRADVQERTRTAADLATVQAAVRPALEGTWGMPGDREWAQGLLDLAEARLGGALTPARNPEDLPARPAPIAPAPAPEAADPAQAVFAALARGDAPAALALAEQMPADQAEGRALRLASTSYGQRSTLLDRVAKARSAKLRLTHPTTRESVDLVAASATTIEVQSPGGATSTLTLAQVPSREVGRLLGEAASAPGADAADHACAVTGLIIGGDTVLATLHVRKLRGQVAPEVTSDLEALVAVGRRAEALAVLARANEAQRSGATKALADSLTELRRPERAAVPAIAAALPGLEAALKDLQEGRSGAAAALADRVGFDAPGDLANFPDSAGTWQVAAGAAVNADAARLGRRDAGTARSVQLILTPSARRGTISIVFKGLTVVFDLAEGQFTTEVAGRTSAAKPCTVVERVPNTIYLAYNEDGNHTTVELNGQVIASAVMGALEDRFALSAAGGAVMQVDEIAFTRSAAADPGRAALRRLGWEPHGAASLDEAVGGIVLSGTAANPAGIGCQVQVDTIGYTLDVRGQGRLRIQVAGQGGTQHVDAPLGPDASTRLTVRWAEGTFAVLDSNGVPLHSAPLQRPVTSVSFASVGACTITLPIRPNRR